LNKFDKIIEESKKLDGFLVQDVDQAWNEFSKLLNSDNTDVRELHHINNTKTFKIQHLLKYAVAIVIIIYGLTYISKPLKYTETAYTKSNSDIITLQDGTVIYLKPNSELTYPVRFNDIKFRNIELKKGSAMFNVASNKDIPFIVITDNTRTEVIGTIFSINRKEDFIEFINIEGVIQISEVSNPEHKKILNKGQIFNYYQGVFDISITERDSLVEIQQITQDLVNTRLPNSNKTLSTKGKNSLASNYFIRDVINHLIKHNKEYLKVKKKYKFKRKQKVLIDLTQDLKTILNELEKSGFISIKSGKCKDCYIISPK